MHDEDCDDGNLITADGCSDLCTVDSGFECTGGSPTSADSCGVDCGDAIKVSHIEECEDGNDVSGDGCSSTCTIEHGFSCYGGSLTQADTCSTICGDGYSMPSED